MGGNEIMRRNAARRVAVPLGAIVLILVAGCGGGGGGSGARSEREADGEVLNAAIARELTVAAAYEHGLALPSVRRAGRASASRAGLLRELRAHALEHVDALTKLMRGLGQPVEAEAEPLEYAGQKTWRDFLAFAYALESRTIRAHLHEISRLFHPWPRSVLGSMSAAEAQQLVLIRMELGARAPEEAVPSAFESGAAEAPAVTSAGR